MNNAEFLKVISGEAIRFETTASGDEAFQTVGVTCCQTEGCVNRKSAVFTTRTLTIFTANLYRAVNGDDIFGFLVVVMRFFLQSGQGDGSLADSVRSMCSWSFS